MSVKPIVFKKSPIDNSIEGVFLQWYSDEYNHGYGRVWSYNQSGLGEVDLKVVENWKDATSSEYAELKSELEELGYILSINLS